MGLGVTRKQWDCREADSRLKRYAKPHGQQRQKFERMLDQVPADSWKLPKEQTAGGTPAGDIDTDGSHFQTPSILTGHWCWSASFGILPLTQLAHLPDRQQQSPGHSHRCVQPH